jgi:MFS family permease
MRLPGNLRPLGYRNFALYWVGFVASHTGKNIELVGAVWLIYQLTGSPLALGVLGLARALPQLVLSPIAGVVVDRLDQRRLLFTTQGLSLVASFTLGTLIALGVVEPWHVYLEIAAQSSILAFDAATRQALFPRLVPRVLLPEAVTLSVTAARSSAFLGPAIGGFMIAGLGEAAPFYANALTYIPLMVAVALMRDIPPIPARTEASFRAELVEGLRYLSATPVLRGLLRLEIVFSLFSVNPVIITIIATEVLGVGPEGLGGLLGADALGALIGVGTLLTLGQPRRQGRFSILSTFAYAAALVAFAISQNYVLSFLALVACGITDVFTAVTRMTIMQLSAPAQMRGRIMANMRIVTGGIGPLAETQSGLLASLLGGPLAVITAAGALVGAAGWTARTNPAFWQQKSDEPDVTETPGSSTPAVTARDA